MTCLMFSPVNHKSVQILELAKTWNTPDRSPSQAAQRCDSLCSYGGSQVLRQLPPLSAHSLPCWQKTQTVLQKEARNINLSSGRCSQLSFISIRPNRRNVVCDDVDTKILFADCAIGFHILYLHSDFSTAMHRKPVMDRTCRSRLKLLQNNLRTCQSFLNGGREIFATRYETGTIKP